MSKPPPAFWQDPEGDGEDVATPEPEDDAAADDPGVDTPEIGSAPPRSTDR